MTRKKLRQWLDIQTVAPSPLSTRQKNPCPTPAAIADVCPLLPRPLDSGALRARFHEVRPLPRSVSFDAGVQVRPGDLPAAYRSDFTAKRELVWPLPAAPKQNRCYNSTAARFNGSKLQDTLAALYTRKRGKYRHKMVIASTAYDAGNIKDKNRKQNDKLLKHCRNHTLEHTCSGQSPWY